MSQDADGGPEFEEDLDLPPPYSVNSTRPPMNQDEFDSQFGYHRPVHKHGTVTRRFAKSTRRYWRPCTSPKAFFRAFISFFPILSWLPVYQWKKNITSDLIGGLTVGVMHVPQGIAYALLSNVQPVVGLYTSLFPPLLYMLFGTSMHNSIGSFAVVALMSGKSVTRICGEKDSFNGTSSESFDECALSIASTLAFCVGLIHLLMAVLRLEIIVTYFSDQLVAGFSTAASCHVFVTQLPALFGMKGIPDPTGIGYLFRKIYGIVTNFDKANWVTTVVGIAAIAFLVIGKDFLNPFLMKKFKLPLPIPFELFLVIIGTVVGAVFNLNPNHGVKIVQKIPTGLPKPHLPEFSQFGSLIVDAISISVVVVAIHISLAKIFGKKLHYKVDAGQELYALGLSSSLSSFFPIYPVSCSLGRTIVNVEAGTKTQLSTLASSAFLIAIIAYFGKWLDTLPMCILSAVVIVALKGMANKFMDLRTLWPLSKIDFSIWVVAFVATVGWDVTQGLGIAIIYALMTTVFRTQFPRWHFLASLRGTNDFRDSERYQEVMDHKGICIFRFDAPLLFTNVERFKENIQKAFEEWKIRYSPPQSIALPEELKIPEKDIEKISNALTIKSMDEIIEPDKPVAGLLYKHFIIDCSGFTFVDYMGVNTLKEVFTEMRNQRVLVYFAAAKAPVRDLFEASGFYQYVSKGNFYPTIRDAVATARKRRNASTIHLLDEIRLQHDALDDMISAQPMN
ncbi:hypothetical protein FO519_008889 [Halicephalobus sp. NKZ332]|nr:hypothetical protein FO519_008889 [Halicephalobus sp. NKZ332]